jgi:plastocyanin
MRRLPKAGIVGLAIASATCGGGYTSPTPTPSPNNPFRVTIAANGAVSPVELVVPPGTRVLFINNDARRHDMTSDPHPEHTDCPELNQVGLLTTGQSRESGNLVAVRTCGFHDHENPDNAALRGRIVVR